MRGISETCWRLTFQLYYFSLLNEVWTNYLPFKIRFVVLHICVIIFSGFLFSLPEPLS